MLQAMTSWGLLVLAIALCFVSASAQGSTATLNGTITDPMKANVPHAKLTVRSLATGAVRTLVTDDEGRFSMSSLQAGSYEVIIEKPGFKTTMVNGVVLVVGSSVLLDVSLAIGDVTEQIVVDSESNEIERQNPGINRVVRSQEIETLPIGGRNFVDFVKLSSGVVMGRENVGGGSFKEPDAGVGTTAVPRLSFGGQSELNTMIRVDGVDNIQTLTGLPRAAPSMEAVLEFRIVNSTYLAEYGGALGGFVNIVTKSGSNSSHGSGYYYGENQALNAKPLISPTSPALRQHQYGITAGGSLIQNRTFFFSNYEGQRRAESNKFSQVILSNLAGINATRVAFGLRREVSDLLRINNYDQFLIKLDHKIDSRNTLSGRYGLQKAMVNGFLGGGGRASPASSTARNSDSLDQSLALTEISVINEKVVNEARFQWARRSYLFDSVLKEPALEIPNLIIMGKSSSDMDFYRESRGEFSDNLSIASSNHQLKFGFTYVNLRDETVWGLFFPARIIFPNLSAFLLFRPTSTSGPVNFWWPQLTTVSEHPGFNLPFSNAVPPEWASTTILKLNHSSYGFFAQDVWTARRNWTFTYGVRYDLESYPSHYHSKKDLNNIQPRVGLAYNYKKNGVIRGGVGLFHDRIANSVGQVFAIPEWTSNGDQPNATSLFPGIAPIAGRFRQMNALGPAAAPAAITFLTTGSVPAIGVSSLAGTLDSVLRTPYSEHASLQIAQDVKGVNVSIGYLLVNAKALLGQTPNLNAFQTGTLPSGKPVLAGRRFSNLGNFVAITNLGHSIYHGTTLEIERPFSHALALRSSYSFSKTISDVDATISVADIPEGLTLDRALSRQNVKHRFTLSFLSRLPKSFGVLRDAEVGSIVAVESGRYYTIYVGSDVNGDGNPNSDRPGSLGRNTLEGPGFATWDLRIGRRFLLNERWSAELTIDFFNLTNRTNIKDLNTVYGGVDLTQAPNPNLAFLAPRDAYNPRQIQYGVKIRF